MQQYFVFLLHCECDEILRSPQREKKAKLESESESILFYWHISHTVPAKSVLLFDILTYEVISTDVPNKLWNKKYNENIKRNKVLAARYYDFCSDFFTVLSHFN